MFVGHFPQKSPIISGGSLSTRNLQLKASFGTSPTFSVFKKKKKKNAYRYVDT